MWSHESYFMQEGLTVCRNTLLQPSSSDPLWQSNNYAEATPKRIVQKIPRNNLGANTLLLLLHISDPQTVGIDVNK